MKKRILSIILAVTMIVTALPFNAFALSYGTSSELADRTIGVNMFNFTAYADNYVSDGATKPTNAQRLEEIEDVLAAGYVNQIFLPVDDNFEATVALCNKYDCQFWISPGYYVSSNQTLSNYVANVELKVNRVRAAGAYDRMLGFYWDEPLWAHKMTNNELLAMTKALYEKWGKRNYVVFAVGSFIDGYDTSTEQVTKASSKYITDAGWDNYGYDVRDSATSSSSQNSAINSYNNKYGTSHANAKELYRWIHSEMMEKFDHDVYTWFFPTGHIASTWTGTADEDFCLAHLNFFKELLYEQEKPGGISLYTYTTFSKAGLEQVLPITNIATGTQKLYPDVAKWSTYGARLKAIKTEFDGKTLNTLDDMPFGSLDVANVTYDTIIINANEGYQYSIDGGNKYQTSGTFTGLKASVDYTVTVKRTSDGKTKTFTVSTTAPYPYSTGYDDTASYILKMPTELNYYSATYGWVSTGISRNKEDTGFKTDSSGNYTSDGYIHLKTIDGERFLEVKNNDMEANSTVYLSFGDQNRANGYKGFPKNLETNKLSAFAFRVKTTGGSEGQLSIFEFFINSKRSSRTTNNPLLYLDKATLEVSELTYSNGINITDNIDGWVIVPFEAYADLDGNAATTNREWLENNLTNIQIWQHKTGCDHSVASSSWVGRTWYVGDMMCVEDVESFVMARQGVTDLPDGTLGYVMDVPETEQFINWKDSSTGALRFNQWHARFLMNQNAANEADPFNAKSYPSSGGGLYVKNIDGETYMVWNPNDVTVSTEYADGTNTPVANYGTYNGHNGTIFWNNISVLENSRFGLNEVGFSAISDYYESNITHLAFRIKIVGGREGQKSIFHLYDSADTKIAFGYAGTYFLDINTGETIANKTTDTVIVLPEGDFDGYMVIPVPTAALTKLQASTGLRIYTFASNTTYHKESDWTDRSVCFGDVYALDDADAFGAQYIPSDGKVTGDTSTNLMTVPSEGGFISYNDSSSYGSGSFWGLSRWSTSEIKSDFSGTSKYAFACMTSATENGENFFKTYVNTTSNFATAGAVTYKVTFLPATYEKGIKYGGTEQAFSTLHANAADYGYIAIRFKTTGTSTGGYSTLGLYVGTDSGDMDITGTRVYNYNTNEVTTVTSGKTITVPDNFDGWFFLPSSVNATATRVGVNLKQVSETDNWDDKTIYFGDMRLVENVNIFIAANSTKNLLTVPDEGGFISYNDSSSYGSGNDWGLRRWNTSEIKSTFPDGTNKYAFACMTSATENGENFFKTYVNTTANFATTGVKEFPVIFIPAVYENNIKYGSSEINFSVLHSDAADYGYVAIRFKTTGASASGASKVGFHVGTGNAAMTITGAMSYNYTTGLTETVASGKVMTVPDNFDGWFIIPYSSLETAHYVGLILYQNSEVDNWDDKTIYFGDIKMIKSADSFLAVNGAPEFTAVPAANDKLAVSNTVDAEKAALYTVDGENWYNIDGINALTLEGDKYYTITAKYPWGVESATSSVKVFNAVDTATALMPVDRECIYYTNWNYNYGAYGLGYTGGKTTRNSTNTGWNTSDGGSAHIFSTELDGEKYWEIVDNPDHNNCRQFNILPLYSTTDTVGAKFANASEFNYLAIRMRFEEDGTGTAVEDATHNVSINPQAPGTSDGAFGKWAYKGVYFYDIKTGETMVVNTEKFDIPLGFNGYVIFPSDSVYNVDAYGTLSDMYRVNVFMHDADGSHGSTKDPATADWTGTTLYIGAMELVKDDEAFLDVRANCQYTGVHSIQPVAAKAPSGDDVGYVAHYACVGCDATYSDAAGTTPINPAYLAFNAASLTLYQNIAINFKVNAANLAGFTNVYTKFTYGDETTTTEGELVSGKYVFTFNNIGPDRLGETVTAQIFGTYNGVEYSGKEISYSVKDYCYNKLNQYADSTDRNEFKTMLVDLLNYGAKAQIYSGNDTDNLINAELSYSDSKLATLTPPTVSEGIKGVYNEIDETVAWNGVNLYFETTVAMKFRFTASSTSGLTVKVMDAKSGGNVLAEIKTFTEGANGSSVAYFDGLDATQMRDTVYVAVYDGDTQVSEILVYSIVAYAGEKVKITAASATTEQKNLASLVSHMMRYGDSAAAYVSANS